jgi:hypothetical protein
MRSTKVLLLAAPLLGFGCGLLVPYPGGGDAIEVFILGSSGIPDSQDPLINPPTDHDVNVLNNLGDVAVALPGASFPVSLNFQAEDRNVVGGGIRFEGSEEIQWTLLNKVQGEQTGDVEFTYVVDSAACEDLSSLCHEVKAEEFVITQRENEFHVSVPIDVDIVLQCATCDSTSCIEVLPPGTCMECAQPVVCQDLYDTCYGEGAPFEDTPEANVYEQFLGLNGSMWRGATTCVEGEALCAAFLEEDRCEF